MISQIGALGLRTCQAVPDHTGVNSSVVYSSRGVSMMSSKRLQEEQRTLCQGA